MEYWNVSNPMKIAKNKLNV